MSYQKIYWLLKTVFSLDAELYNGHYEVEPLKKVSCYEMTFKSENGNSRPVLILFIEESTLLYLIGKMTCISLAKADKNAFQSYIQLSQKYTFQILKVLYQNERFELEAHRYLSLTDLRFSFKRSFPKYSLLWKTDHGFMGFCLK